MKQWISSVTFTLNCTPLNKNKKHLEWKLVAESPELEILKSLGGLGTEEE
jgi:hypothetical protein